jgi:hypothetical protein
MLLLFGEGYDHQLKTVKISEKKINEKIDKKQPKIMIKNKQNSKKKNQNN